ncbi:MAG: hypothetical protein INR71_06315 [Terriglobus roseus]|nr:hypothetical protein [Terriglobus roseus]
MSARLLLAAAYESRLPSYAVFVRVPAAVAAVGGLLAAIVAVIVHFASHVNRGFNGPHSDVYYAPGSPYYRPSQHPGWLPMLPLLIAAGIILGALAGRLIVWLYQRHRLRVVA